MEFVKYIGPSQVRMILPEEWAAAGVTDMGTVGWSAVNNWSVPVDSFTDKAMEVAIRPDPAFVVIGGEQHAPRYIGAEGTLTPEQGAGVGRVDMNTAAGVNRVPAWLSGASPDPSAPTVDAEPVD